jgi:hypothetical protein
MTMINASSPVIAAKATYPYWANKINVMSQLPSDGYEIWACHVGEVTVMCWATQDNHDGTKTYLVKHQAW